MDCLSFCHAELLAEVSRLHELEAAPALAARCHDFSVEAVGDLRGLAAARMVSGLNDAIARRIVELTARRHRLPSVAWCWLLFGSEGRAEQTLVSDQDNGLVFDAADEREAAALRELFLPFAAEANEHLAAAGLPLCPGGIMAGNPAYCLSLLEWRERFIDWVRMPDPAALLNASIFFDLRPLHGEAALAERLTSQLLALTEDTPAFLHLMAANALAVDVPLNFIGEIAGEHEPLDLKKFGSRIFVDAARIFALAAGSPAVETAARLRLTAPVIGLSDIEAASAEAAFSELLRLRFDAQRSALRGGGGEGLRPDALNDMDRSILREALKQARRLQQRLKLNYGL